MILPQQANVPEALWTTKEPGFCTNPSKNKKKCFWIVQAYFIFIQEVKYERFWNKLLSLLACSECFYKLLIHLFFAVEVA